MYKYSEIEAAIAKIHNVTPSAMKTFRSRIRNFQRIGVVPSSPGKGQKISYSIEYAIYWALCFEFVEVGLSPSTIKTLAKLHAYNLIWFFEGPTAEVTQFLVLGGDFLSWHMNSPRMAIGIVPASELQNTVLNRADLPRVILIDMTALKRKLGDALRIDWGRYRRNPDPSASPAEPQPGDRGG